METKLTINAALPFGRLGANLRDADLWGLHLGVVGLHLKLGRMYLKSLGTHVTQ
jgi:hypothetical protein